jgi:hypothetical protein
MKLNIIFLATFFAVAAFAEGEAVKKDPTCANAKDPFDIGYRITSQSTDQGDLCVNGERFRPLMNLRIESDQVSLQNYFYRDQFWKADFQLNEDSLEAVFFHIKRFATVKGVDAAHTQVRYRFKKGFEIELTNQLSGEKAKVGDLVVSFEAAYSKQKKYNFALGTLPNYPLVARIGETATFLGEAVYPLEQYELNLSAKERVSLLTASLKRSEKLGISSFYNTLRPNCTSEQFDLFDQIERIKGKAQKFLTVLSGDPIATPSIQGLQNRGLLKQRVQNYGDEAKGQLSVLPVPIKETPAPDFLPATPGKVWSLVVVNPKTDQMTMAEKKAFIDLRGKLLTSVMGLLQSYGSAVMLKDSGESINKNVLFEVIQNVQKDLRPELLNLDNNVSHNGHLLAVYMVPFKFEGKSIYTSLTGYGIEAAMPVPVIDVTLDSENKKSKEIFYWIGEGLRSAGDQGAKNKVQAYLQGIALVVNAKRGASSIQTQAMVGLNPQSSEMNQVNSQVKINRFTILPSTSRQDRASALVSHEQIVSENSNPQVVIEFGPDGGISGGFGTRGMGGFQVYKSLSLGSDADCQIRARAVPQLTGVFGAKPTGTLADKILEGRPVTFQVMNAYFDLASQKFSDLDINVSTFPVVCSSNSTVNSEFTKEANKSVDELKKKIKEDTTPMGVLLNQLF